MTDSSEPTDRYCELPTKPGERPLAVRVTALPSAPSRADRAVVLLVHGFKGFMHWGFFPELARRLARAGLVVVSYNASHNGVSARASDRAPRWEDIDDDDAFARNTHALEVRDLDLVRAWVRGGGLQAGFGLAVDAAREGLFGHSRGGGIALLSAARAQPRALVAWAPIDDIDRVDASTKAAWRATGTLAVPNARTGQVHHLGLDILDEVERADPALDVLGAARRVTCPTLVVHGTDDGAVPFSAAERLMAALPKAELLALAGANHAFGASHPLRPPLARDLVRVLDATVAHFTRHLGA